MRKELEPKLTFKMRMIKSLVQGVQITRFMLRIVVNIIR